MPRPPKQPTRGTDTVLENLVRRIDARSTKATFRDTVATGFLSLDRMLGGGLRRQDLVVLAGDVDSGKSALALSMAIRAATAEIPTMFFSGEIGPERVFERALAIEGRATVDQLRNGELDDATRSAIGAAALRLRHLPLVVRALPGVRFEEVSEAVEIIPPRQLVVVDSLQLLAPPTPTARLQERVALAARALKRLAVERNLAVLVTAQLPYHRADRTDPRPVLDD